MTQVVMGLRDTSITDSARLISQRCWLPVARRSSRRGVGLIHAAASGRAVLGSAWIGLAVRITLGSTPSAPIDSPRLRTSRNFALLSGEGGQDLSLLALGHIEVIKGIGKFRGDFVEHGG